MTGWGEETLGIPGTILRKRNDNPSRCLWLELTGYESVPS